MSGQKQMNLGAFMRPVSLHTGAWRYPGAYPDANFNFKHIKSFAQKLEAVATRPILSVTEANADSSVNGSNDVTVWLRFSAFTGMSSTAR